MLFAKLHGLGNDFLLFDWRGVAAAEMTPARAVELCDRHRGVGGDGVLTLTDAASGGGPGKSARMIVHNSDGSRPEMCGNGARCAALWVATRGCTEPAAAGTEVLLITEAGPRHCVVTAPAPGLGEVTIEMGRPHFEPARAVSLGERSAEAVPVSMGNPHRVIFTQGEEVAALARQFGPGLCQRENANIEFVSRLGPLHYRAAVWERGAGFTQACGTGACAVAAAAVARGEARPGEEVTVELPGGPLALTLDPDGVQMRMRGPAQLVFRGDL